LPMAECMDVMAGALRVLARGGAVLPLRSAMAIPGADGTSGLLLAMPAYLSSIPPPSPPALRRRRTGGQGVGLRAVGLKVLTVYPENSGTPHEPHQGAVLLFDPEHGTLQAILDATEITAVRTAAVSGVATQVLARPDAGDLALIGSGVQARTHLEAMSIARPLRRVRVWSRNPEHARAFVEREAAGRPFPVEAAATAEEAVADADIVCTVTSATEPVVEGEWIAPGAHINAAGAYSASSRELDTAAVVRSRLFVDRREAAHHEAGEFLIPRRDGAIGDDHIRAELGELLIGQAPGRSSHDDITIFKSLGLAIEDLAAAHHVYTQAVERGIGTFVELG
ncbi:MAG TPA: ornithine cyclodeaminase family protein, partial [Dehalococcoidia bacterium]|nr:ornithine cyclodeaminase family protein [Dehalococcoidia bacterium]